MPPAPRSPRSPNSPASPEWLAAHGMASSLQDPCSCDLGPCECQNHGPRLPPTAGQLLPPPALGEGASSSWDGLPSGGHARSGRPIRLETHLLHAGKAPPPAEDALASRGAQADTRWADGRAERLQLRPGEGIERVDVLGRRRRYFSLKEIARHTLSSDCWLIAHGRVYDATEFLPQHPAGEFAILRHAGRDASVDFDFHSPKARPPPRLARRTPTCAASPDP